MNCTVHELGEAAASLVCSISYNYPKAEQTLATFSGIIPMIFMLHSKFPKNKVHYGS